MADFDPVPPPLDLPDVPAVLSPSIPLNPPMVGSVNPFQHVDGNNRDLILEAIRTWIRVSLLPWTTSWQEQLTAWEGDAETQLDAWMVAADAYITAHAISGYSFRPTVTDIAPTGTTNVVLANVDEGLRPVVVGDLVLDNSPDSNYGIVTVVIDSTHATVAYVGSLRGLPGYSWRITATPIAAEGTTNVLLVVDPIRPFALGDLVLDTAPDGNYGNITALIDATHVTVTYQGSLRGPQGIQGDQGEPGTNGTNGTNGADGIMHSIVQGNGILVDSTDPANPVISVISAATWYYSDPVTMNNALGSGPKTGDIGVLNMPGADQNNSVWVVARGKWTAVSASVDSWITDWYISLDLGTNTNLQIDGISITEAINGTRLRWNHEALAVAQERGQNRYPIAVGANTTPSGSVVFNPDNSISLTACIVAEVTGLAPTMELDGTDEYEMHIVGEMESNGIMAFYFSGTGHVPQLDGYAYASFGETLQLNAGVLTHDPDFVAPFGNPSGPGWDIVTDTTGSPVLVEAWLRVAHSTSNNQKVASIESVYYDTQAMTVMFKRSGTFYMYDGIDYDGFYLHCTEPFTGTVTQKAI